MAAFEIGAGSRELRFGTWTVKSAKWESKLKLPYGIQLYTGTGAVS